MMSDIFSSFDPMHSSTFLSWVWLFMTMNILVLMAPMLMWNFPSRISTTHMPLMKTIMDQLMRTNMKHIKSMSLITSSLFITLILINLLGMIPYVFSLSSHLLFTLSMGLPMWMSMMISSFSNSMKQSTAHLLPDGAPMWLNPFLVIIETISVLVRPLTLSFRLAANMTAGHIVLILMSNYTMNAMFFSSLSFSTLFTMTTLYIMFELAICLIQAYIFCLLLSLYSDDHSH